MSQAATLSIALAIPAQAGSFPQSPWPPPPGIAVAYEASTGLPRYVFSGAGTITLSDMALLPTAGAQVLTFSVDAVDDTGLALTAPVTFTLTGTTHGVFPITGGGAFGFASPGTTGGVTGLTITATAPAVVRVSAVG